MLVKILKEARNKYKDIEVDDIGNVQFIAKNIDGKNLFLYRVNSYFYILEEDKDFEWLCDYWSLNN